MNIYPKYIPKLIITVIDKIIRKKVVVVADNSPNAHIRKHLRNAISPKDNYKYELENAERAIAKGELPKPLNTNISHSNYSYNNHNNHDNDIDNNSNNYNNDNED
jgi:hypothetical protein